MSEYLTPEQMESFAASFVDSPSTPSKIKATLRAYAKVVEAVAELNPWHWSISFSGYRCAYCDVLVSGTQYTQVVDRAVFHKPDCPHLLARKLRGHAE